MDLTIILSSDDEDSNADKAKLAPVHNLPTPKMELAIILSDDKDNNAGH